MSELLRRACDEARKGNSNIKQQVRDIGNKFLNNLKNSFSEFPNGSPTHGLPEYRLDALTTELWRTHGEQGRKLGFYV